MIKKLKKFVIFSLSVLGFLGLLMLVLAHEAKLEKACAEQGMIYVQTRGDRGYCAEGFRP